ncbi:hypothetical protein Q4I28_000462, partial [Leishmania naiffi]
LGCAVAPLDSAPETGPPSPSPVDSAGIIPGDLSAPTARTYCRHPFSSPGAHHFAVGRAKQQRSHVVGGIVERVSSSGALGALVDNTSRVEAQVSRDDLVRVDGRSRLTLARGYFDMVRWIRDAGVQRRADRERLSPVLFQRGWRVDKPYPLGPSAVRCMSHVKRPVRTTVLERAEWQCDHHAELRVRRYFTQKHGGFASASWAGLGVTSVLLWNLKSHRRHRRSFQVKRGGGELGTPSAPPAGHRPPPRRRGDWVLRVRQELPAALGGAWGRGHAQLHREGEEGSEPGALRGPLGAHHRQLDHGGEDPRRAPHLGSPTARGGELSRVHTEPAMLALIAGCATSPTKLPWSR